MTRLTQLDACFVEFVPAALEPGMLYISKRYATASHLCCCGCGLKVVTPLKPTKWQLIERGSSVSLHPSIGNWSFPCRSHYWIKNGQVHWAGQMSADRIVAVQARDRHDAAAHFQALERPSILNQALSFWSQLWTRLQAWWRR
jgi:hypothetical protein